MPDRRRSSTTPPPKISRTATAYNIPGLTVDGIDVFAVYEAAGEALARPRRGEGPTLIECKAFRYYGHLEGDPLTYSTDEMRQEFRARDPINRFRKQVLERGLLSEVEMNEIDARTKQAPEQSLRLPARSRSSVCAAQSPGTWWKACRRWQFTECDVTELVRLRGRLQRDFELTYTDLAIQAAARALEKHPRLNASLDGDRIRLHDEIHIGMAVALEEGLIVPVIRDANRKTLREIARETKELAAWARQGAVSIDEVTGSTFSVTNLGSRGIDGFTPIINPPEAAILGVGRIVEKPAAYQGAIALRHLVVLSLTHDHRLVDGAQAADFLRTVAEMLELPYLLSAG